VIREYLPDFDLTAGPQVDVSAPAVDSQHVHEMNKGASDQQSHREVSRQLDTRDSGGQPSSRKRAVDEIDESDHDSSVTEGAQSVATNLGMLSLNSDSSQRHYIGSSSGILFTALIGASPLSESSAMKPVLHSHSSMPSSHLTLPSQDVIQKCYHSLHLLLRQVSTPTYVDETRLIREALSEEGRRYSASTDLPQ
jgi:hypothetical protein